MTQGIVDLIKSNDTLLSLQLVVLKGIVSRIGLAL